MTDHNAYSLEVTSLQDALWHLGEPAGDPDRRAAGLLERYSGRLLRLEGLGSRQEGLLRRLLEEEGGRLFACRRGEAGRGTAARQVLLAGGPGVLARLAQRLRREPRGLPSAAAAIEDWLQPRRRIIRWGQGRVLDFEQGTRVMGILNITPNSFYPGSRSADVRQAVLRAKEMVAAGADILDVGGESTRPGADPVDPAEEAGRVIPVIREIRRQTEVPISIDTRRAEVAAAALEAGADLLNDISGLSHDPRMARLAAERGVPVIVMHMRGSPQTMQELARYGDTVSEVIRELRAAVRAAIEAGVSPQRIIVDPGIGFSKKAEDNLRVLKHLPSFASLGFPLLVGLSRKSFLGQLTGRPVEERLAATIAAHALAVQGGADILRVHDVAEAVETVKVVEAVLRVAG